MIKPLIKKALAQIGYTINRRNANLDPNGIPIDIQDPKFMEIYNICKNYSMCSVEPMYSLYKSVEYIVNNNIEGDMVECGVYKGGSAMMMAFSLMHFGCQKNRKIFLYDTYEGMPEPSKVDINLQGIPAEKLLIKGSKETNHIWCYSTLDEVRTNMFSTGYKIDNFIFIKGKVEDTIPKCVPEKISILRLDTDWYSSTFHELKHLYPLLNKNGVLTIDDYGHWQGARKATDDYFNASKEKIFFHRIDYSVRVAIKNF
jgi:O-methyltransferase